ncbi:LOW QUALITY PROTEIN: hypothetical protein MKX08_002270 [Trichoderma sp. CBMAI-0020]|nr:LOW QUALITY PROTEIN: hypothetical protein MKX08_002270 [Trichoderma sp. CBMAI-0020]
MPLKPLQDDPWRPLDFTKSEIRVIELSPAQSPLDSIMCQLRTVSLLDQPEYEALSYVWGGSSGNRHILLNGKQSPVTDSLFEALAQLRDAQSTRTLWVDAVCINQKYDIEKNIQVMMMDRIYAQASKVLVWLLSSETPELSDDVTSINQNQERHFTQFPMSMLELSKISWWHRAWTFQEAALAKNLIFHTGRTYFTLEDLEGYLYAAGPANGMPPNELVSAYVIVQELLSSRRIISQGKKNLLDLIVNNRGRVATKVQDKVYAYLGLAYDVPTNLVRYELSLREWTLHISTRIIQHNESLKIIHYASHSVFPRVNNCRMEGLPSWCPDWTQSTERSFSIQAQERDKHLHYRRFSASSHTKANPNFPTPEILGVSGVVCDTVTHGATVPTYTEQEPMPELYGNGVISLPITPQFIKQDVMDATN